MRLFPRFHEERILREEIALIYQNYVGGLVGYFSSALIASGVIYNVSGSKEIFYWFSAITVTVFFSLTHYWWIKDRDIEPKKKAIALTLSVFMDALVWAILPLFFLDADNAVVLVTITILAAGLCAGGMTMQSPCMPAFLVFSFTILPATALGYLLLGESAYVGAAIALILFLGTVTTFAFNLEKMFVQSIELRFENLELIGQLQEAMTETEEANRAKSVFLASASHDLRQPLHAMGLFIETLSSSKLNASQQNIVEHIESASEATRKMLNTLLDFSKLDAGVITSRPQAFRLQTLLNKLENELGVSADNKGLIYRTRETAVVAYADPSLVELVLRNLIMNAIRYTDTGGILVGCRVRNNQMLALQVWDSGIGISQQDQDIIFGEFQQLGNPERDGQKGFGLGLAIAKGLANTMQLELTVNSKLGIGSMFQLCLPQAEVAVIKDIPTSVAAPRFDGKRILVIDDNESVRLAMRELLLSWNCECLLAESADEALSLMTDKIPDLLIVDFRLREERTGQEAIMLLREKCAVHLPAIIITGDTAANRLRDIQESDALLLHKPVATTELQRVMNSLLN
ncbi:MAG: hybrid sensor histidine kinase/response regulator [SAR86 cluster bacterium]|uniref:histidine kinase n=1 Tax=SAR86 cluster bacterium TaxID=2030880 RepID=A0A2A5ATU8_9GAMM|nr:MAG: hybrid sensor histidine kinase/response regulator [SAR86 cluster bacterium]